MQRNVTTILALLAATLGGAALALFDGLGRQAVGDLIAVTAIMIPLGVLAAWRLHLRSTATIDAAEAATQAAQRAEAQARAHGDSMLAGWVDPAFVVAHDGTVLAGNLAAAAATNRAAEDLPGTAFADLFTERDAALAWLEQARMRGSARDTALHLETGAGTGRSVRGTAALLAAAPDRGPAVLATLRHIDDLERRERERRVEAQYLRSLIETSVDPLLAVSPAGTITDVNQATLTKSGIPRESLIGMPFADLFSDPHAARRGFAHVLAEGRVEDCRLRLLNRTGAPADVALVASLYRDTAGKAVGIFVMARDVTEATAAARARDAKDWVVAGIAQLNTLIQDQPLSTDFHDQIIGTLTQYVQAHVGALYVMDGDELALVATHAYTRRKGVAVRFRPGEGLVGQVALERQPMVITEVPADYIQVSSGLGASSPRCLCLVPMIIEGKTVGVLELASLSDLSDAALEYLRQAAPTVGVAVETSRARQALAQALQRAEQANTELLAQQAQLEQANTELAAQQTRIETANTELRAQQAAIEQANTELVAQQARLEQANAELEEQTVQLRTSEERLQRQQVELEESNNRLRTVNADVEQARADIALKAEQVALASKHKSEFLSTMSHELRTPLNSLLLLARSLRDNATGNLDEEQVESASVIYDSGNDLLNLINEILDLSRIEAGRLELHPTDIELSDLGESLLEQFGHMAREHGLELRVETATDAPTTITSDRQRLEQVLKNLLGNAIKFTDQGRIGVTFGRPAPSVHLSTDGLAAADAIAIRVEDTGIGIPADKQQIIFEAFQQGDTGDRRRYGGTGLGLAIARDLTAQLGGEIQVESEPGKGSAFTVYLPERYQAAEPIKESPRPPRPHAIVRPPAGGSRLPPPPAPPSAPPFAPASSPPAPAPHVPAKPPVDDDRDAIATGDRALLVIEDDLRFARIVLKIARERGFKCLLAGSGEDGLDLARQFVPDAVVLDLNLPGINGWTVLDTMKNDIALRHIPVHIVSVEEASVRPLRAGAIAQASKPIDKAQITAVLDRLSACTALAEKHVLVVEDDPIMRREVLAAVGNGNVKTHEAATGDEAVARLAAQRYDLLILDLGLPDETGLEMLKRATERNIALPPIIVYTARDLTGDEEYAIREYAESIVIKDVRSHERLIDQVAFFLHRVVNSLPDDKRRAILHLHASDEPLKGRKALVVEDDMRTMFAMAKLLAEHGMHPLKADNGQTALETLAAHPDTAIVLIDMMMPVMDGYEAMRRIRTEPRFATLPIVALTAKAMPEDRLKCIEAGATDYLAKPVDGERMCSLMRVLLCR